MRCVRSGRWRLPHNCFTRRATFSLVCAMPSCTTVSGRPNAAIRSRLSRTVPSKATAPYPDSVFHGSVILLTTARSSARSRCVAISAATGAPPAGMASTSVSVPRCRSSMPARTTPACVRSRNTRPRLRISGRSKTLLAESGMKIRITPLSPRKHDGCQTGMPRSLKPQERNQAAKLARRTGSRRAPQSPGLASNTPAQGVPQVLHLPPASRFHAVMLYQSRPISLAPQ